MQVQITESTIGATTAYTVNSRELHQFVESKQQYADWAKNRLVDIGAVEGEDYLIHNFMNNPKGGRPTADYIVTLDIAKHLAMMERNDKGREIRQYFIDAEKKLQSIGDAYRESLHVNSPYSRVVNLRDPLWREALYLGYDGKCFYTGKCLDFDSFHVDHVLPSSRGGQDRLDNLVLCDPSYNMGKQAIVLSDAELSDIRNRVIGEYAPKVLALYIGKQNGIVAEGVSLNTLMNPSMMKAIEALYGKRSAKRLYAMLIPALDTPEALEEQREERKDTLSSFIECYIITKEGSTVRSLAVYDAYLEWCETTQEPPMEHRKFTRAFKKHNLGVHKDYRFNDGGVGKGYRGIAIAVMGGA